MKNKTNAQKLKMSNNLLFAIAIVLILANSYYFMIASREGVTGKAGSAGTTSICIGITPKIEIPTPHNIIVVNSTFNSTVRSNFTEQVTFSYYLFGELPTDFGIDTDPDNDTIFNSTLNVTGLPDGNCNYRIRTIAEGVCGITDQSGSSVFTINNVDIPPVWDKFKNNLSTNFSNYTSWTDISNATIGIPEAGTINFGHKNFDDADIDYMFNISHNDIRMNISWEIHNCFDDVNHRVTFFNITQFAEPVIVKNGELCDTHCYNLEYNNGSYTFVTRVSGEYARFSIAEGGNISINFTMENKTYDNSPTINISTYIKGFVQKLPIPANCTYKTDYNPTNFTIFNKTGGINHSQQLSEHNWSYIQTGLGHYDEIQHHDFYSGEHVLTVNCTLLYPELVFNDPSVVENFTFNIAYTERDRVVYSDGDEVKLYLRLEEPNLTLDINLSELDSNFDPANISINNTGLDYNISYNISQTNTRPDGQYNITIEAFNSTGEETMNGSMFIHLHNTWARSDIEDAFDCWSFKPGYYFDEASCDWESDVNRVAKIQIDLLFSEISCYDGIDNDGDGQTDIDDTDCAGVFYDIRRTLGINSAFLADPCINNLCYVCLGVDAGGDGFCDTSDGVNVQYLNYIRPGGPIKARFTRQAGIVNSPVRVSVNYLDHSFGIDPATSSVRQLPYMELGRNITGGYYISVTGTSFDSVNKVEDYFTGNLDELITTYISPTANIGAYPSMAVGRIVYGSTVFQNMVFLEVSNNAILNESDNATYCFDNLDNDLNTQIDCRDFSCNLTYNPLNSSERCEYPQEITCNDGYDNDWDGFTDCEDNDCFQKNGTTGPCYAIENFNTTSCADSLNNDHDYGAFCDPLLSRSLQDGGGLSLTDCRDIDCDGQTGSTLLGAFCEYCNEITCNDNFDNDADSYYDCTGNAWRSSYERDCDRWHDVLITCPTIETDCSNNLDDDLDSDSLNGGLSWLGIPVYGGWDCQDLDCNTQIGNTATDAICQWGNETLCEDNFDNDGDGLTDCEDPTSCQGVSGAGLNLTGQCRPCADRENISVDACRDTDDNDYDGDIDCADINCTGVWGPGIGLCGFSENNCTDGIDNDYDWKIDLNDTDCASASYAPNEYGPGMCDDSIDNDNDGGADCADSDCQDTMVCKIGTFNPACTFTANVGAISVCTTKFVRAGSNFTAGFSRNPLSAGSLLFILGNAANPLKSITPVLNTTTTFMTGTTTNFAFLRGGNGVLAENNIGFNGNFNMQFHATTSASLTPGDYNQYILTSVEGTLDDVVTSTYISENEPPTITNITAVDGHTSTGPGTVAVTFTVNATDNATYNSGIALCQMELPGEFLVNSSTCSVTANLGSGTYNLTAIAYDGALNPSTASSEEFVLNVWTYPGQTGNFYNPYPAENYPDKNFFNNTENLNIGVNFDDGSGFTDNTTGCVVNIRNSTHIVLTEAINLSASGSQGICTGQVDLQPLMNQTTDNTTNHSEFPSAVYYFDVTVEDDAGKEALSEMQDFHYCYYYWDNSSSKYRCRDKCSERGVGNRDPVFLGEIPNQTWPRATKLSVIDLDDYFIDPDGDPLEFTWTIDSFRINVSYDRANIVTFDPDQSFYGFAHITFHATDPFGGTVSSNEILLEVVYRELPHAPPIPAGGGGGGGVTDVNQTMMEICEEDWTCSDWGPCLSSGYQFRTCRDRNECGTTNKMPNTTQICLYTPTCRDKLRNQEETGVDCGGPCPPCPSCKDYVLNQQEIKIAQIMSSNPEDKSDCGGPFCPKCPSCDDNIWNGGELGIDCGGICGPCSTCTDGIRNQGEVNIDCGGPCPSCKVHIEAIAFNWNLMLMIISSLLLLILLILALLFGVFKKKFIRLKARLLNYHMRLLRMFEKKKLVEKEIPILNWVNTHLDNISADVDSKGPEQAVNSTDRLVRIFFKRVFLIRYAFTNDELLKDLEKHKIPVVLRKATELLFEELSQIKYGGETVDKPAINTLIEQVRVITERLVTEIETKKKTKISISERDIDKISETLSGAKQLGVHEALKKKR